MFQPELLLPQSHPAVAYLAKEANAIYGGPHRGHGDINKTQGRANDIKAACYAQADVGFSGPLMS